VYNDYATPAEQISLKKK